MAPGGPQQLLYSGLVSRRLCHQHRVPGGMLCPLPDYVSDLTRFQAWGFVRVCPKGGFRLGYDGVLLLPPGLPDLLKCCVLDVKIFACMLVTSKVELAC